MPSIRLFMGKVSGRKPHIFKDRNGIWRVIPARYRKTLWDRLCEDELEEFGWKILSEWIVEKFNESRN